MTSSGMRRKLSVERAHQHHRPFDKPGDLVEEAVVLDELQPLREGELLRLGEDDLFAPLGIGHDLGLVELLQIIVEAAHRERLRRHEAMAARDIAGGNAVDVERHDVGLLGLRSEGREDGMQRPHPGERAGLRRRRAPAHRFRPGKAFDDGRQNLADHVDRGAARLLDHRDIKVALLVRLHFGVGDRFQSGGFEKSGDRLLRRADPRALLLLAQIGLSHRHAVHGERQPPWRHERLGALIDEPGFHQPVGDKLAQILRRPRLHPRRDFLGKKFEQEVGHYG